MSGPKLAIVVDTEEEFDWDAPFSRANRGTSHIPAQALAHEIYDPLNIVPCYVIDHPVATDARAVDFLSALQRAGKAEIGAHLHPWVTPPDEEELSNFNSFHCNLSPELERAKVMQLTEVIAQNFGLKPRIFKAGRYGYGPNTRQVLLDLGYEIDCSFVPHVSFAHIGGPSYYGTPDQPFWLDDAQTLLEIPLTSGFFGALGSIGPRIAPLFDSRLAARAHIPALLAHSGLVARTRLSPEGVSASEQCALLKALVRRGQSIFTLTYHSPSLAIGHTPYVRNADDLSRFINAIRHIVQYFCEELGGSFTTLSQIRAERISRF